MRSDSPSRTRRLVAAGVFLLAALVFLPALWNDFVSLDDSLYVYNNSVVKHGLSAAGIVRVFTAPECNFYHPLTMLSLMLDEQVWGLNPFGYHLTALLVHAGSAALLFLALAAMTGAMWRSAFVAAIFAVHPLRVESVAWIAERKDVLSVFFFMVTLAAYVWYARRPGPGSYLAMLSAFVVGLLCKTSLVTMPGLMLLLDYWPLRRFSFRPGDRWKPAMRLVIEKVPLVVLAMIGTVISAHAQKAGVIPYADFPLPARIENAVLSYVTYIAQTVAPVRLSPFYPFLTADLVPWKVIGALALLIAVTVWALAWWRRTPYFLVGWFWYLGVLVPMLGLVQVGTFSHADRFTYLPQIGLLILFAWGVGDLICKWRLPAPLPGIGAAVVLVFCSAITIRQIHFWSDSETLFRRALAVTHDNGLAESSLGSALLEKRRHGIIVPGVPSEADRQETISHYRAAVRLLPDHADTHLDLGLTLAGTPEHNEAIKELSIAIQTMPFYEPAQLRLGLLLVEKGDVPGAIDHLEAAVQLAPNDLVARNNLGACLRHAGRLSEAIEQYRAALAIDPHYADAHNNLGIALYLAGDKAGAIQEFQTALRCDPSNAQAKKNLEAALQ
jgi:thioredoxin-like negative regulator of GroEL